MLKRLFRNTMYPWHRFRRDIMNTYQKDIPQVEQKHIHYFSFFMEAVNVELEIARFQLRQPRRFGRQPDRPRHSESSITSAELAPDRCEELRPVAPRRVGSHDLRLEREKGFEPSTPTLATWCSTPELLPHVLIQPGDAHEELQSPLQLPA